MDIVKTARKIYQHVPYSDHIKEHEEINSMFSCDCDNMEVKEHLSLHMEYRLIKNLLSPEIKERYLKYKRNIK